MVDNHDKRSALREALTRGVALTAPVMIAVAGLAGAHAMVPDTTNAGSGYYMFAAAEAEGEAEGEAEAEAEAEGEAEGEAEAEGESEAEAEGEAN